MENIIFIHAGLPKTGTTSIQKYFTKNRDEIFKKTNIYYPTAKEFPECISSYRQLGLFPIEKAYKAWEKIGMLRVSKQNPSFFFSVEEISFRNLLTKDGVQQLKLIFPHYKFKIIIFLRRLDEFIKSLFLEEIRVGNVNCNLMEFIHHRDYLVYQSKLLEHYFEIVGRENVIIGLYKSNVDIIKELFFKINIRCDIDEDFTRKNTSFPFDYYPFLTKSILPKGQLRKDIRSAISEISKIHTIFETHGTPVGNLNLGNLDEEINKIETYAPGYKDLFDAKPIDFSFSVPLPRASSLLAMKMLYAIRQENILLQEQMQEIKALLRNHVKDSINH